MGGKRKELSVICIKVVVKGKDQSTEGVVYMTKSTGPRTEPWETPQEEVYKEERLSSHLTQKERDK